jgi:valyl-tRNA synthetase
MEIAKTYEPGSIEEKWYQYWMEKGYFRSIPDDRKPYTIVIPPPNVTGILHMGHMLNNTIQDVLIRRKRMEGYNACWVPGTDHASIATEAKVTALLAEQGIDKKEIGREAFLEHAWSWKEKYGGIILEQLKKIGASCDWDRTRFTMEESLSEAVIATFVDLFDKGLIYRGVRMVNWDPKGLTAVSDEEVIRKESRAKLFYLKYPIQDNSGSFITIATTRPETILADSGIAVHPEDERYKHLVGKMAVIPLLNKAIPIITSDKIDPAFGTGCLKVTPAHDIVDYEIGIANNLPILDILNPNGTLNESAVLYVGMDRFAVRKKIVVDLEEAGFLDKVEEITNSVGYSERTDAVIEPKLSMQWFLKMEALAGPALEVVESGEVQLIPKKFLNTYRHWMENIRDWCISRQLWWGHRIPAWYDENGTIIVAKTESEAKEKYKLKFPDKSVFSLTQDSDVLDTWFSSWLWPIAVFDGFKDPNNKDISYYYPTNDLVTAPEILFFWVARMIMAGMEYRNAVPFKHVYLTGIVRDKAGRKMSKSLGNSPDPIELIHKYSADGVRFGMLLCSPAGNDLLFDESHCEQGRNFANKLWNAFRLVKGLTVEPKPMPAANSIAIDWMGARIAEVSLEITDHFEKFRISDAQMAMYKLIWDDFCAWYLELVKPPFGESIDEESHTKTLSLFSELVKFLHPFMPFITEEIFQNLNENSFQAEESIMISQIRTLGIKDKNKVLLKDFAEVKKIITELRAFRNSKQISPKQEGFLYIRTSNPEFFTTFESVLRKFLPITEYGFVQEKPDGTLSLAIEGNEFYQPLPDNIDIGAEREKIQKEIDYQEGFLKSVSQKLSNEKFIANAKPEIIASEQKKRQDAEARIAALKEGLLALSE